MNVKRERDALKQAFDRVAKVLAHEESHLRLNGREFYRSGYRGRKVAMTTAKYIEDYRTTRHLREMPPGEKIYRAGRKFVPEVDGALEALMKREALETLDNIIGRAEALEFIDKKAP